jgi:preprotein translocase subunit SecY
VWLSQQITARGIGNGIALIILSGIVAELPAAIAGTFELSRQGVLSPGMLLAVMLLTVAVTALVAAMERARRYLPIRFAERQAGTRMLPSRSADLVLKLNPAGIMPAVLASWLASIIAVALSLATLITGQAYDAAKGLTFGLGYGTPLHLLVSAVIIVFLAFLYTAFVCDPEDMAEKLAKQGGLLPQIASEEPTAAHLDHVISRTAAIGATYLGFLILLPEILISYWTLPLSFPSTSLLVLVCAILDIEAQVRAERQFAPA